MKVFKKSVCTMLVLLIITGLCACGGTTNETENTAAAHTTAPPSTQAPETETTEPANAQTTPDGSFFDEANYTVSTGDEYVSSTYTQTTTYYILKNKPQQPTWPSQVTLGDKEISLNRTNVSALIDSGWVLRGGTADTAVDPKTIITATTTMPDGKKAELNLINRTDAPATLGDCQIVKICINYTGNAVYYDGLTEAADFRYAGEITSASSLSDITAALGEPTQITVDTYFPKEGTHYTEFSLLYADGSYNCVYFRFRNEGNNSRMINVEFDRSPV